MNPMLCNIGPMVNVVNGQPSPTGNPACLTANQTRLEQSPSCSVLRRAWLYPWDWSAAIPSAHETFSSIVGLAECPAYRS